MLRSFQVSENFKRRSTKLIKSGSITNSLIGKVIELICNNPGNPRLRTHKVNSRNFGKKYSSKVTGDVRIIWDYSETDPKVIILLDIGGHSGKHSVYN